MSEQARYYQTSPLTIKQYDGSETQTVGMTDESQTIVALAVGRPGRPTFQNRPNSASQLLTRTLMFGDIALFGFKKTGEHQEGEGEDAKIIIDGELGAQIMESKSWMIMQTKDPTSGEEREPYVRTPWDVRQTVSGNYGNMQPATMAPSLKLLADEAINLAAEILAGKVERNEPIRSQAEYAKASNAASKMAGILVQRRGPAQNAQQQQQGNIGGGDAITAGDLGMDESQE